MSNNNQTLTCNFCGKGREEVSKLVVANDAGICNECISLCSGILRQETNDNIRASKRHEKSLDPIKIKEYLDCYVIGQDKAKEYVAVAVTNHYKRIFFNTDIEVEKSNLLIQGPTGVGKTLIAKMIAKYLDVPFVVADATTLTEAGYVGDDVEVLIERLLAAADYDVELCERGIIFVDEIDKIGRKSESASITRDVSGEGVQQALLKLVEGTKCTVKVGEGKRADEFEIDTSKILFIAGGAFVGLEQIVERRTKGSAIGFSSATPSSNTDVSVLPMDIVQYGMIPEFVGRFPCIAQMSELSIDDLKRVLTEPKNNLIAQMSFYFQTDGIEIEFLPEAVDAIAELAYNMHVGARGLRTILEKALVPYMYSLRKLNRQGIKKIIIDASSVKYQTDPKFITE